LEYLRATKGIPPFTTMYIPSPMLWVRVGSPENPKDLETQKVLFDARTLQGTFQDLMEAYEPQESLQIQKYLWTPGVL
jgi:hypothetical protein